MLTMAQRIEQLRQQKGISRPALSAALGLPRTAVEKFETGRQTPTQAQQRQLAGYFGVSVEYLRGESPDPVAAAGDWMDGAFSDPGPAPAPTPRPPKPAKTAAAAEDSPMFAALLSGKKFQEHLRAAVLEALASPEGQALLERAIRRELDRRK